MGLISFSFSSRVAQRAEMTPVNCIKHKPNVPALYPVFDSAGHFGGKLTVQHFVGNE